MKYRRAEAKEWARASLRDYIVTTTTPFGSDLTVDEDGLRSNVRRMMDMTMAGGIYVGSIYQEFSSLTMAERKRITELVTSTVNGRRPVMVGISSSCAADAIELGQHARDHGADLVMLWPPTFGHRPTAGVLRYFAEVIPKLDIGVCVYATSFNEVGFQLTPTLLSELAEFENVCAVKEASKNVGTYLETLWAVGQRLVVSAAHEEYWLAGWLMAGEGTASRVLLGSSRPLYLEQHCSRFLSSILSDDLVGARNTLGQILHVAQRLHGSQAAVGLHNVAMTKALSGMMGWAAGPVRPPLVAPSSDDLARARALLDAAGSPALDVRPVAAAG
jgi:4-hydroxy-tetrahydrodipicolinate synthase